MIDLPKIAVATLTYDDAIGLDRLYKSIIDKIDFHIIIRTRFPEQPSTVERDYDTEIIIEYFKETEPRPIIIDQSVDQFTEYEARNQYLKIAERLKVDALLILDSDEYVDCGITNWKKFYEDVAYLKYNHDSNVYGIVGYWGTEHEKPRLWINPEEMTYYNNSHKLFKNKNHDNFLDQDGCMMMSKRKITTLRFIHDSSYRTEMRRQAHDQYKRWLDKYEGDIEQRHFISQQHNQT